MRKSIEMAILVLDMIAIMMVVWIEVLLDSEVSFMRKSKWNRVVGIQIIINGWNWHWHYVLCASWFVKGSDWCLTNLLNRGL